MTRMGSNFWANKVFHGDCIEGMKHIPAQSVDLVITDPPFGIGWLSVPTLFLLEMENAEETR